MKEIYVCEKCFEEFDNFDECIEHEESCDKLNIFICDKCGKKIKWRNCDIDAFIMKNQCHYINLGRMGYGSGLDGCDVNFKLCDQCLRELIYTFKFKDNIYNSGSNCYCHED